MTGVASTIIFWFPRLCHLSERLSSVWGPDAGGEKAPVSGGLCGVTVGPM